jgi:hypothetical protein
LSKPLISPFEKIINSCPIKDWASTVSDGFLGQGQEMMVA